MKKIFNIFKEFKEYFSGDFAYKKYLEHQKNHHKNCQIISKKQFLNSRRNNKWKGVNRCC